MTIHQISVFLENRAGQLAEITGILAENNIDLRALNIAETTDYGVVRLIVSDPIKASTILLEHGFILTMTPVVAASVVDRPGGLAALLKVLAEKNVDVQYMYSIFGQVDGKAHMIFRVTDSDKLVELLKDTGFEPTSAESLGIQ